MQWVQKEIGIGTPQRVHAAAFSFARPGVVEQTALASGVRIGWSAAIAQPMTRTCGAESNLSPLPLLAFAAPTSLLSWPSLSVPNLASSKNRRLAPCCRGTAASTLPACSRPRPTCSLPGCASAHVSPGHRTAPAQACCGQTQAATRLVQTALKVCLRVVDFAVEEGGCYLLCPATPLHFPTPTAPLTARSPTSVPCDHARTKPHGHRQAQAFICTSNRSVLDSIGQRWRGQMTEATFVEHDSTCRLVSAPGKPPNASSGPDTAHRTPRQIAAQTLSIAPLLELEKLHTGHFAWAQSLCQSRTLHRKSVGRGGTRMPRVTRTLAPCTVSAAEIAHAR